MKTHKLIFAVFVAMTLGAFVLTGCSNEEEVSKSQTSNSFLQKEAIDLSKDIDFVELYNLISDYEKTEKNVEQINYFISKLERYGDLSNEDMELFAISMGYKDREDAAEFTEIFIELSIGLDSNYGIFSMEQSDIESIFIKGFQNIAVTNSTGNCNDRFNHCANIARGVFGGATVACIAASIAIGTANFWNAGIVGWAAFGICMGSAALAYDGMLGNCSLDFDECMEN